MRFSNSWIRRAAVALLCIPLAAQISQVLTVVPTPKITARRGQVISADVQLQLRNGFHVNSNKPNDPYLIPMKLTWTTPDTAEPAEIVYPKPQMEKLEFSKEPVSIYSGDFKAQTRFKILATAPLGESMIVGKLRYQACNNRECLAPRTVEVKVPVYITN